MASEILMPRQGNTVESCVILEWRKSEGDAVAEGEVLCEVETDKATFDVESTAAGTLLRTLFAEGDDVPVLTPIAYVGEPGEEVPDAASGSASTGAEASAGTDTKEGAGEPVKTEPAPPPQPAAAETPAPGGKLKISPRARRYASERGVDPTGISGSGPMGRIIERDVKAAAAAIPAAAARALRSAPLGQGNGAAASAAASASASTAVSTGDAASASAPATRAPVEIPVKGVRKIVAERMLESLTTTAQLTLNTSADARSILAYRKKLKASPEQLGLTGITLNDIVHYAVLSVLPRFPELNQHFLGDRMLQFANIDLGYAVDTDRGLMVPVIRNADTLSLKDLASEAGRLTAGCLEGTINPDDLTGGTFTITNLGVLGIESFTPVLNPPQAAILGVCAVQLKPVPVDGETQFIPHIGLSLTINHQAVDGAPAARFLAELRNAIADFELVLAG